MLYIICRLARSLAGWLACNAMRQFEAGVDKFMIVASDGIWEFIDNHEAISIVAQFDDPQKVRNGQ